MSPTDTTPQKIHHLNCGTMCPLGERLMQGEGSLFGTGRIVAHCLLVEGAEGLVLIDTGFGTGDIARPRTLGTPFNLAIRPQLIESETALAQVKALGFEPGDVRHIIATHLDVDHAGGLPDFPEAEVHVLSVERDAALDPSLRDRARYPKPHIAHGPRWAPHEPGGDHWHGFESIRVLPGSGDEILMIPLKGHSAGHSGVAVRRGDGWLLHCGDAYFSRHEMQTPRECPPGLRAFQSLMQADGKARHENQERLRELAATHGDEVELICAHDAVTFDEAAATA